MIKRREYLAGSLVSAVAVRGSAMAQQNLREVTLPGTVLDRCRTVLREGLLQGLDAGEFWPAMHAAEGLTVAGDTKLVIDALLPKVDREPDPQRRCGLIRELARAGNRSRVHQLPEILRNRRENGRTHAAESMYKILEVGDGRDLREATQPKEDPILQLMAWAALARGGHPSGLPSIRRFLASGVRDHRRIAGWILGLLGDVRDIPRLREIVLEERDLLARSYAEHALACLGDAGGLLALGRNLRSSDPAVRTYAAEFAGYARAVLEVDRLEKLLGDPVRDVRVRAAQSLLLLSEVRREVPDVTVDDPYSATDANPRYSEGSIIALRDGSLLYVTTGFQGGGADHATARIVGRTSSDGGKSWSSQRVIQENTGKQNVMSATLRRLHPTRQDAPIGLFYLEKNGPEDLQVYLRMSRDEALTFEAPIRVTQDPGYHVLNNDRITVLKNGRLICPVATTPDLKVNHFQCYSWLSDDQGRTWTRSENGVDQPKRGAMEPEVLERSDGSLMMIIRTQMGVIATATSNDGGRRWSPSAPLPVRSPESPATIRRIPSTGDLLLIWNNGFTEGQGHGGKRAPLSAAISRDEGQTWSTPYDLDRRPGEQYAYTSVLFHQGRLIISYYVERGGKISSRFQSVGVGWLYRKLTS